MATNFTPNKTGGNINPLPEPYEEMTANGAVPINHGLVWLNKDGVLAATITSPPVAMNGAELTILALTANAHTVTYSTTGFNSAGTAGDVATFGGAVGDAMTIRAVAGVWYTVSLLNVTLG